MSRRITVTSTPLSGVHVLQRQRLGDDRGYFERLFCDTELESLLGDRCVRQINRTHTAARGTVRGLHFQRAPHAETKVVSCLRGEVFDVAVDLRQGSPTFLRWHGEVLSGDNGRTLFIPEGFAHGLQTLTPDCEMLYFHTAPFVASSEGGVNASDPRLAIAWPLPVGERSARDLSHPMLDDRFQGIQL
jgi:dTDP-4-dehydrorhamnose 3,5-epimerase